MHVESFRENFPQNHPPANSYMAMNCPFFNKKTSSTVQKKTSTLACSILPDGNPVILNCQFLPSHCSSTTSLLGVRSFVFSGGLDLGKGGDRNTWWNVEWTWQPLKHSYKNSHQKSIQGVSILNTCEMFDPFSGMENSRASCQTFRQQTGVPQHAVEDFVNKCS